jgi:hypothetical protein
MPSIFGSILSVLQGKALASFTNETTNTPCWTDAKIKDVEITSDSANAEVPISNQQVNESSVFDGLLTEDIKSAKIIQPTKVKMTFLTDNISLINSIMSMFADTSVTIGVKSKSVIASSMAISNVAIDQTPEMISAARVTILLEQTQPEQPSSYNNFQAADAPNLGLGFQTLKTVGPSLSSVGNGVGSLVSTATNSVGSLYQRVMQNIGL